MPLADYVFDVGCYIAIGCAVLGAHFFDWIDMQMINHVFYGTDEADN
jgi:hypothetical protein